MDDEFDPKKIEEHEFEEDLDDGDLDDFSVAGKSKPKKDDDLVSSDDIAEEEDEEIEGDAYDDLDPL